MNLVLHYLNRRCVRDTIAKSRSTWKRWYLISESWPKPTLGSRYGKTFNTTQNHPLWGVFWHKKVEKILRLTWFYPNFFFEKSSFSYISIVCLTHTTRHSVARVRPKRRPPWPNGGQMAVTWPCCHWVKPCYPKYFFDLFMPKNSSWWVILPGVERFFISRP